MAFSKARRLGDLVTSTDGDLTSAADVDITGDVGIGTTSPDNTLHIHKGTAGSVTGNPNAPLTVENSTSNFLQMLAPNANESGILFGNPANSANAGVVYSGLNGDLQFRNAGNTERMRIDSAGRVGVGLAGPQSNLHVHGATDGDVKLQVTNNSTGSAATDGFNIIVEGPTPDVLLRNRENSNMRFLTNNTERMRISEDGNVGIGTTSPSEELEVNGTVKATAFEGDGSALTNVSGGKLLQVVQTVKTDTWSSSTTTSWVDITGLNVSITPASSSNKVLVNVHISTSNYSLASFRLVRGSTVIAVGDSLGGNRIQATMGALSFQRDGNRVNSASISFLDTPSTTSSTTYKLQAWTYSGTQYINRSYANYNYNYSSSSISTITASEISA